VGFETQWALVGLGRHDRSYPVGFDAIRESFGMAGVDLRALDIQKLRDESSYTLVS